MTWRQVAVFIGLAAIAGSVACSGHRPPRPPEHFADFHLQPRPKDRQPTHRAAVTGIRQHDLGTRYAERPLSSMSVDVKLGVPETGAAWRADAGDFELAVDVPEGTRLVAAKSKARRPPDRLSVRRDGQWTEREAVTVPAGGTRTVRLRYERVAPYAAFGPEDSGYFRPVATALRYTGPDGTTRRLTLTDPNAGQPVWTRDHVDARAWMLVGATAIGQSGDRRGIAYNTSFGGQYDFVAPWYLRWGLEVQVGQVVRGAGKLFEDDPEGVGVPYGRLGVPVTAGVVLRKHDFEWRVGGGWASGVVFRGKAERPAVPHWAVLETELVIRDGQRYPFRTTDFTGNFGLYSSVAIQLGNFAARREPSGVLWTAGFVVHPEL